MDLKSSIRAIPDYPKPGIMFRDITTLLADARAFRRAVDELVQPLAGGKIHKVAGIEARGFILGGAIAHQLSVGVSWPHREASRFVTAGGYRWHVQILGPETGLPAMGTYDLELQVADNPAPPVQAFADHLRSIFAHFEETGEFGCC